MNPIETAKSYYEAWKAMDISKAATYLAAEVTFDVPINFYHTKEDFIDALAYTAKAIKDVRLLAAYGDDESALLVYDMELTSIGTLRVAEHLKITDGSIMMIRHIHDTALLLKAGFTGPK